MPVPWIFAKWEGLLLLGGFVAIVLWKLANGSIGLDQLFEGDIRDRSSKDTVAYSTYVSPGRVQSFVVTALVASYYLLQVIQNPGNFPTLPSALIGGLAGSQLLYLGGKAQAMLLGRSRDLLP